MWRSQGTIWFQLAGIGDPNFRELEPPQTLTFASWNRLREWLRRLEAFQTVA